MGRAFIERLKPAPRAGGFRMEGYWVWCGSAIRGEDGRYHLFASRWPSALPMIPHWLTNSEVVRAVADRPEGPYAFEEVVLPPRAAAWDGRMTHNPTIHKRGDTFLLFYTGTTYTGPTPEPGRLCTKEMRLEARANQRIGVATSKSVRGPWTRLDRPVLEPRPGKWDGLMTTNPAPCVNPDGSIYLIYKSTAREGDLLRMGAARAARPEGPYERVRDESLFAWDETRDHVEDAYVWRTPEGYELLMKDMRGGICGERGGGIHARSKDGADWTLTQPPLAYSRKVRWDDGTTTEQTHLERPQLLIENGRPTHLIAATSRGDAANPFQESWTLVIPLEA
ncbi:MAG: glycoside hydrolase family protein [Planctomycetota bacterium]|nr:glycoside hydrolase family protein [Planctomycetota bacterium]